MTDTALNKKDLATAKQLAYDCRLALQELDKIEACGFECKERREVTQWLLDRLTKILANYGPANSPLPN